MLTDKQLELIKNKMKKTNTYCATFARRLNVSRQAVNFVINRKYKSERIEKFLLEWLNE